MPSADIMHHDSPSKDVALFAGYELFGLLK